MFTLFTIFSFFSCTSETRDTANTSETTTEEITFLKLQTTPPKIEANAIWDRALLLEITPNAILLDGKEIVSLNSWEVNPEEVQGLSIVRLYDELYDKKQVIEIFETKGLLKFDGRLMIAAHPQTPYHLLRRVMFSAGRAAFYRFGFLVIDPRGEEAHTKINPNRKIFHPPFTALVNSVPVAEGARLSRKKMYAGDTISCQAINPSDADNDRFFKKVQWIANEKNIDAADLEKIQIGDQLYCILNVSDGMSTSVDYKSESITILDPQNKSVGKDSDSKDVIDDFMSGLDFGVGDISYNLDSDSTELIGGAFGFNGVYHNCIDSFQLNIGTELHLPKVSSQNGLPFRGTDQVLTLGENDYTAFKTWTHDYVKQSISGHSILEIQPNAGTSLDTVLYYSSTWSSYEGHDVRLSHEKEGKEPQKSISNEPFVLKRGDKGFPVVELTLPAIGPSSLETRGECIGKDGKRYEDSNSWKCRIYTGDDTSLHCSLPIEKFSPRKKDGLSSSKVGKPKRKGSYMGTNPIILGGLDKKLIDNVLTQNMSQLQDCYHQQLSKNPDLGGKLKVKFTITRDGAVSKARVKDSTMGGAGEAVESCIVERFKKFTFPKPKGGIVIAKYSFGFYPD